MSTVIKSGDQNPTLVRRLETVNVTDHLAEARLVLDASREKSLDMLRCAQREASVLREASQKQGYDDGFKRGYDAGLVAGREKAYADSKGEFAESQQQLIAAMGAVLDQFETEKRDLLIAARADVMRFAMRVAERVTRLVGVVNPDTACANLDAALRVVAAGSNLEVRLHPQDVATVEKFLKSQADRVAAGDHVRLIPDEKCAPGGCILSGAGTQVDATLDTQLEQIAQLMVGAETGG